MTTQDVLERIAQALFHKPYTTLTPAEVARLRHSLAEIERAWEARR